MEHNIEHCRGCFDCWGRTPGMCAIDDDMSDLMDLYLKSDYVGLATPVYSMYMTGLLKNLLDRFLPLAMPHIQKSPDGSFYHKGRVRRFPQRFFIAKTHTEIVSDDEYIRMANQHWDEEIGGAESKA